MPRRTRQVSKIERAEKAEAAKKERQRKASKVHALTTKRVTVKKAEKKPKKVGKRPTTAYFLFTNEKREEVKAALKEGEKINEKLAQMWRDMSEDEKKVYSDRYKKAAEEQKEQQEKLAQARREKMAASRQKKE